jgi:DNA-directed RNA polymerase subunit beta'
VHTGDYVQAGDPLTEGPLVPHDILRIKGEEALWAYMLDEVQNVYRAQGVVINDKHIELILSQMLRKVKVESPGDTDLLPQEVVDKFNFKQKNNARSSRWSASPRSAARTSRSASCHQAGTIKEANAKAEAAGKEGAKAKRAKPATGPHAAPGHHQGRAVQRVVPLGCVVPGEHQGAHRGGAPRREDTSSASRRTCCWAT